LRGFCEDNDISGKLVIDITPSLIHEERRETYNRGDEIAGLLKSNTYNKYVILDDLPKAAFRESQYPHLVQCQQDKGFAEKKLAVRAGEILGE